MLSQAHGDMQKFNPEQYSRDQEAYIIKNAQLTQQEAAAFMPLLREMLQKQRTLYKKHRQLLWKTPQNDKEAAQLIKDIDELELQIKKIETHYHTKFCKVIPPAKVHKALFAMSNFKRITMEKVAKHKKR